MKTRTPELKTRWQQRFLACGVTWTQMASLNPDRGLAGSNRSGVLQLYAWDIPTGNLRPLTDYPTGKMMGYLSPDGSHVYYLKDEGSNEIGHYVRVPFEGGPEEDITPNLPPYASYSITASGDSSRLLLLAAAQDGFKLYMMDIGQKDKPGEPRLIHQTKSLLQDVHLSSNGQTAVVVSTELSQKLFTNLLAIDADSGIKIAELWDGGETSLQGCTFSPMAGDQRVLATTNRSGFERPLLWNPHTGERRDFDFKELDGDVTPCDWSPDGRYLLLQNIHQARQQFYLFDLQEERLIKLDHPCGTYTSFSGYGTYFTDKNEIITNWQDATHPAQVIALDMLTGRKTRTVMPGADVPPGQPWKAVTFPSSDGTMIQAWLAVPQGQGPFPTILHTHGGPTGVMTESFDPQAQTWLDHGFAFLTVNYRGSTTFGKDFQNQIVGDLGHWEVEDVEAGLKWLIANGIADPARILKTGWSYGGYMTLMCLGKLPEYFAGGMAGIAIADWSLMYEDQAPTLRGYQVALFGGTPETHAGQYRKSSPITYAENVRVPVLIIQGSNDTRCPVRQMKAYLEKMKKLGKQVDIHWFEAGHGSMKIEEKIRQMQIMLDYAYHVLGE
ncbi:MAG: prolyl oligopeptidase family serine peptidase [Chloroflexi bacterium]|nr:prolyl oligopeptidase family serine peptidase [Chloroflexota bacterium]